MSSRHRIFTEPAAFSVNGTDYFRLWRVQLAGQDHPVQESALNFPTALALLEERLLSAEWWKAQDPVNEAPRGGPRTISPPPPTSWWARFLG